MTYRPRNRIISVSLAAALFGSCDVPPDESSSASLPEQVELQTYALTGDHECATPDPSPARQRQIKADVDRRRNDVTTARRRERQRVAGRSGAATGTEAQAGVSALAALAGMKVPVYVHNIKRSGGSDRVVDGHITSATIDTTISRLNTAFSAAGITFVKRAVRAHVRPEWFEVIPLSDFAPSAEETAMKTALREGGPNTLNIYTRGGTGTTSSALFPWQYWERPWRDGVSIHVDSFPRTGVDGDVVVHEVGHWLGLWHAFQNGCDAPGDEVDDTPAVRDPNRTFCPPTARPTCNGGSGLIDNYMDYAPNSCSNVRASFTQGQIDRAVEYQDIFRLNFDQHLLTTNTGGQLLHAMNIWGSWTALGDVKGEAGQIGTVTRTDGEGVDGALQMVALVGTTLHHTIRKDWAWTPFGTFTSDSVKAFGLGRHNGDLHVCYVRTDNNLRHIIRRPDGTWSSSTDVKGSAGGSDPSGTILSADCGLLGSDMHYVTTNSAGQVHWTKRTSGGTWSSWKLLTTQTGAKDADIEPGNGELHLVVTQPADQRHVRLNSSGTFVGSLFNVETGSNGAGEIGGTTNNTAAMGDELRLFVGQSNNGRLMLTERWPDPTWFDYYDLRSEISNGTGVGTLNWIGLTTSGVYP